MSSEVSCRLLDASDAKVLESVTEGVFDHAISPVLAAEFLADPRHHLAIAAADGMVVGFASAVHYVHPDKPPELWINEVGVAAAYRRQGLAGRLLNLLFDHARSLGCKQAWVLTEAGNEATHKLYSSMPGSHPPTQPLMFEFDLHWAGRSGEGNG